MVLKKLAALLLILIVCFNTAGYFIVFKARQLQIKSEVRHLLKSNVPEEQLIVIIETPQNRADFKWIHSREFRYHGTMYDVVRKVKLNNNQTELLCLNDSMETNLFQQLDKWVKDAMNHDKKGAKIFNLLSGLFSGLFPPDNNSDKVIPEVCNYSFYTGQDLYKYLAVVVISHPPQF